MAKAPKSPVQRIVSKLKADITELAEQSRALELTRHGRRTLNAGLNAASEELARLVADLDPIKRPGEMFDPGNPRTIGYFIALAMAAQPRRPLAELRPTYGAG